MSMLIKGAAVVAGATLALLAASAGAQVASTWRTVQRGGSVEAEIASRAPGAVLRISCADRKAIWLNYHPPRTWNGNGAVAVRIGDATFPMVIDGGDGALLSNAPNDALGVTRAFTERLKAGGMLVLEGTATARVPAGQRTFALAGAAEAIAAVERACPGRG
jgi:hypothetical protein